MISACVPPPSLPLLTSCSYCSFLWCSLFHLHLFNTQLLKTNWEPTFWAVSTDKSPHHHSAQHLSQEAANVMVHFTQSLQHSEASIPDLMHILNPQQALLWHTRPHIFSSCGSALLLICCLPAHTHTHTQPVIPHIVLFHTVKGSFNRHHHAVQHCGFDDLRQWCSVG